MMPSNPPTVCTLGAEDLDVREEGWRAVAHAALRVRVATSTGVRHEVRCSSRSASGTNFNAKARSLEHC
jgi:hypothetical protein